MGKGEIVSVSRKQKMNKKILTAAELLGVDDASSLILRTNIFLEAQGYKYEKYILYQDNKIIILSWGKGKDSLIKRTRHLNIRYVFSCIKSRN